MLVELAHVMIMDSKLPEFLWELAVAHTVYLQNMSYTLTPRLGNQTPYQIWYGKKPNVSHLHEFSAPVWVLLQGQNVQRKMLPKLQRWAYIGYDKGSKAIRFYNAVTKNIQTARNYCFLTPADPSPPKEIGIEMPELKGGEGEDSGTWSIIPRKRTASDLDVDLDPEEPWRTRGIRLNYKYMNDPFPDEEEAGIIKV